MDFEAELAKFQPSLDIEQAEDAIYGSSKADVTDLIHACNLDLISIDYAGNSVYQFVRKNFSSGTYLAVHINDVNTIMTVIQDGILVAQKIDDFSYNTIS